MDEHTHYPDEIDAARRDHRHEYYEIDGSVIPQDLRRVSERLDGLAEQVREMQAQLEAERAVSQAVREGNTTLKTIAAALRTRGELMRATPRELAAAQSSYEMQMRVGNTLCALASDLEALS